MADSEIDKATIVNWALIDLGQPASFSIDEESELGGIVDNVWQRLVDHTFGLADWTFCRRTAKLNRREATPVTGYAFAFDLPGDKVGDPLKLSSDPKFRQPVREFYLEGLQVHSDEAQIYARCRVLVDPVAWDPAFRAAFVTALAGYLAIPVLQDSDMAEDKKKAAFGTPSQGGAGGEFGRLIAQNRASSPIGSPFGGNDVLVDVRQSGGRLTDSWHGV